MAVIWAMAALALAGGPAVQDETMTPPLATSGPVEVWLAVQILDFARVNSRDESYDVTAYVEARWTDPRLARSAGESGPLRRFRASKIWTPRLYFANALEQPKDHGEPEAEVEDNGQVTFGRIVSGKFSADLDLRAFPFDEQKLPLRIGSYYDRREIVLDSRPNEITIASGSFLTDWDLLGIAARNEETTYGRTGEPYPEIIIEAKVARRPTFYLWRILLPMSLLVMVSWLAFWFEPVGLQPQISTCFAVLIALAMFNFGMDFSMPKQDYLTFIDRHALLGFAIVAGSAATVARVHRFVVAGKMGDALRTQRLARWGFPAAYALATAGEVAAMLTARSFP